MQFATIKRLEAGEVLKNALAEYNYSLTGLSLKEEKRILLVDEMLELHCFLNHLYGSYRWLWKRKATNITEKLGSAAIASKHFYPTYGKIMNTTNVITDPEQQRRYIFGKSTEEMKHRATAFLSDMNKGIVGAPNSYVLLKPADIETLTIKGGVREGLILHKRCLYAELEIIQTKVCILEANIGYALDMNNKYLTRLMAKETPSPLSSSKVIPVPPMDAGEEEIDFAFTGGRSWREKLRSNLVELQQYIAPKVDIKEGYCRTKEWLLDKTKSVSEGIKNLNKVISRPPNILKSHETDDEEKLRVIKSLNDNIEKPSDLSPKEKNQQQTVMTSESAAGVFIIPHPYCEYATSTFMYIHRLYLLTLERGIVEESVLELFDNNAKSFFETMHMVDINFPTLDDDTIAKNATPENEQAAYALFQKQQKGQESKMEESIKKDFEEAKKSLKEKRAELEDRLQKLPDNDVEDNNNSRYRKIAERDNIVASLGALQSVLVLSGHITSDSSSSDIEADYRNIVQNIFLDEEDIEESFGEDEEDDIEITHINARTKRKREDFLRSDNKKFKKGQPLLDMHHSKFRRIADKVCSTYPVKAVIAGVILGITRVISMWLHKATLASVKHTDSSPPSESQSIPPPSAEQSQLPVENYFKDITDISPEAKSLFSNHPNQFNSNVEVKSPKLHGSADSLEVRGAYVNAIEATQTLYNAGYTKEIPSNQALVLIEDSSVGGVRAVTLQEAVESGKGKYDANIDRVTVPNSNNFLDGTRYAISENVKNHLWSYFMDNTNPPPSSNGEALDILNRRYNENAAKGVYERGDKMVNDLKSMTEAQNR